MYDLSIHTLAGVVSIYYDDRYHEKGWRRHEIIDDCLFDFSILVHDEYLSDFTFIISIVAFSMDADTDNGFHH